MWKAFKGERGLVFLDTLMVALLALSMAGLCSLARTAMRAEAFAAQQKRALFLAQMQVAEVLYKVQEEKNIPTGAIQWLGDEAELSAGRVKFAVDSEIEMQGGALLRVAVYWQDAGKERKVEVLRAVR